MYRENVQLVRTPTEIEREHLTIQLKKHGLSAESYCTIDELRRKLSAARAMDIRIDSVENKYF